MQFLQAIKIASQPNQGWGPAREENRTGRYSAKDHTEEKAAQKPDVNVDDEASLDAEPESSEFCYQPPSYDRLNRDKSCQVTTNGETNPAYNGKDEMDCPNQQTSAL